MCAKRIFRNTGNIPINDKLNNLEALKSKVAELKNQELSTIKEIRAGFVNCVVVFIDLVDSTKFKIENQEEPEKWILRLDQFSQIIKEYIENSNGRVVKYIGDELMGIFDQATMIDDALSLIIRIQNIQSNLSEITESPTKIKIALDYGNVYLLRYSGHNEPDPQGTPVDRCARIAKHCIPGTILSSYEFVTKCSFPSQWTNIGNVDMKGIGNQAIYQFGEQTIRLSNKVEIEEKTLNNLNEESLILTLDNQTLTLNNKEMVSTIGKLQNQLKEAGKKPIIATNFQAKSEHTQKEKELDKILQNINVIKKFIYDSGVSVRDYARFLFLNERGISEEYNRFQGKTFDSLIEKDLVKENSDERYELNSENRRNKQIVDLIDKTQKLLDTFIINYGRIDPDSLFEYSFSDADFWKNYLDINVV